MNNNINLLISASSKNIITFLPKLEDGANVFLLFRNKYDNNGDINKTIFDEIDSLESKNLQFINCIINPVKTSGVFCDNVLYILWFTNNIKKYKVYKDEIREKSIWKDVEWGKREKNYNKKGKDPGNVWIPTEDDGKGNITNHILLSLNEIIERIIKFSTIQNDRVLIDLDVKININDRFIEFSEKPSLIDLNSINYSFSLLKDESKNSENIKSEVIFETSETMKQIQPDSLSCMVTSPPYWDIKNYYKKGQIGQESYSEYQNRITSVWKETMNKISDDGSIWININTIFKNKKIIPIPFDIIRNCKSIGLHLKAIIIWHKSSAIPTHALNLCDHFEYVLVFTKNKQWFLNENSIMNVNDYLNADFKNGSFWNINRKAGIIGKNYIHPAVFPVELIERIICFSTKQYSLVMDPFLGSGTSLLAALNNNRSFIGYEFYEGFKDLIQYRIDNECKYKTITKYYLKSENLDHKIFRKEN